MAKHEPKFLAMAEVLNELGMEVEALGEVLCRDAAFADRHCRELQAIDLIAQKQRALAAILTAGFSEDEMRRISLDALRERFCGFLAESGNGSHVPAKIAQGGEPSLWD